MAKRDINLSLAFGMPPKDAVSYFRSKGIAISDDWQEVWAAAHARAFTVAKATELDVLTAIRAAVDSAISEGWTAKQFQANLKPQLEKLGWWGKQEIDGREVQLGSPYRLNTIYRQNLQTAYMAGRYRRMLSRSKTHPYWQYVAIDDGQTRPAHARLRGKVFRFDDPIWDIIYPPNGWGCRCRVRALTEAQVKAMGLTVENGEGYIQRFDTETVARGTGEVLTVPHARIDLPDGSSMSPDLGWAYNPGSAAYGTDVAMARKLGQVKQIDTRAQYIQALNNSELRQQQFAQWASGVLSQRRAGHSIQSLGFMTPSIQQHVAQQLGHDPMALLAIGEKQLLHADSARHQADGVALTHTEYLQLPYMLANPQAVLWDSRNNNLMYIYPADNSRKIKIVINATWNMKRQQPLDVVINSFKVPLDNLRQPELQLLEGSLE